MRQIVEPDGVTVDGRIVEARQINRRDEILRQNAALGFDKETASISATLLTRANKAATASSTLISLSPRRRNYPRRVEPSANARARHVGGRGEADAAQAAQNVIAPQRFDEGPHGFSASRARAMAKS